MGKGSIAATMALVLLLAACGHDRPRRTATPEAPFHPAVGMLLPYVGPDGSLTRAQMEAGLRRDFAKADTNHDGCLDANEVRAVNELRWQEDASTASPLIDFQQNGCIDYDEFAATPRSVFDLLDRKGDGKLTPDELKAGGAKTSPAQQSSQQGHRHGGGNSPDGGN